MSIKQYDSLELGTDADLTECSLVDAVGMMGIDIASGAHIFTIHVNLESLANAHRVVTQFNRVYDNIVARTTCSEGSTDRDEWLVVHLESGKSVYSCGA